jgi:SpoVK/Ycf46/Vps4 family AAA+-type ATPase
MKSYFLNYEQATKVFNEKYLVGKILRNSEKLIKFIPKQVFVTIEDISKSSQEIVVTAQKDDKSVKLNTWESITEDTDNLINKIKETIKIPIDYEKINQIADELNQIINNDSIMRKREDGAYTTTLNGRESIVRPLKGNK